MALVEPLELPPLLQLLPKSSPWGKSWQDVAQPNLDCKQAFRPGQNKVPLEAMRLPLARVRTFLLEVPRQGKLAYCLLRDPRIPPAPKLALGAALAVVASPVKLPGWIPVAGELDSLALGILAVKVFVDACPDHLVQEHQAALKRGESLFDQDLSGVTEQVQRTASDVYGRWSERAAELPNRLLEDRSA
ncbi:MAG: hypothetical protein ACR2MZ_00270 [Candidatus Dormibacter sp.]|uniref:hypothetical protein n=1 Tax=Candidatus Dormibacter sp. TaxID=2973982 RepID=UPI000DB13AA1|nr:MAG: hypothetical protein DLM66_01675 [Candidatus Dormibacteraeota bacterium]